jgi:hypothetical protein
MLSIVDGNRDHQTGAFKDVKSVTKSILLLALMTSVLGVSQAATILPNGFGLTVDTFPNTLVGTSFTDSTGNVLTVGSSFFVVGGVWYGSGDLTAVFANPVTAVGFTFLNLCSNCTPPIIPDFTLIESVTLSNGDSYNIPTGIAGGQGAPSSQFFGVSSATGFTTATFHNSFSSFGISDFRFGSSEVVPEPVAFELVVPGLLAFFGFYKVRSRRN